MAARDRVVLEHVGLVRAIARRIHETLPVHVDPGDLESAGMLGLLEAAEKFNKSMNVAFGSYAKHRIRGSILDSLRQLDWASRDMRRLHKRVEEARRDLALELQRNPTDLEIAKRLGVDEDRWRQISIDLRNCGLISASTRGTETDDLPAPDFPCNPRSHPDALCSEAELRTNLQIVVKDLPPRYQRVIELYYSAELTMKEIGGILGINESRVSQIHAACLEKLKVLLEGRGIASAAAVV